MKFHPYAEIFPLLDGTAFDELVEDIRRFGLREKIWLYDGDILDGRNRYRACVEAGVEPEYRHFSRPASDALALVVSANIHRRQLTESQRAMAAARIATLRDGQRSDQVSGVPIGTAAQTVGASVRSTKRARQVLEKGSKALQHAVDSAQVTVSRAAAVVDLPKAQQLKAATAKPEPTQDDEPERPEWEPDEDAQLEAIERETAQSIDRVMQSDDRLAAAHAEIKRQAAEIAVLKASRDHYLNEAGAAVRLVKTRDREIEKLRRTLAKTQKAAA